MVRILNCNILSIKKKELLQQLERGVLFTPNIDHLVRLQRDREFCEAYQKAEWVICDSVVLCRLSRLLKNGIPESIPGSTFFREFCVFHKSDEDIRIFILGGKDGVPQRALININRRIGREIVIGAHSPSFQFVNDERESLNLVNMIEKTGATVLVVCATSPKQEVWIARYRSQLPSIKLFMALGATVDFEAGNVKRCPLNIQKMGMEWFWRFCQEPRRLFKRYFVDDMMFFWYFGKQLLGGYHDPFVR